MKKFLLGKWKLLIQELKSEPKNKLIGNILYTILGSFLLALGTEMFLIPMKVIAGGSSSLALIFSSAFGQKISTENLITIIYWICFFIGLFTLGIRYSLKTLIVTITSPLFIYLLNLIIEKAVVNGYQILSLEYWAENGITLASIDMSSQVSTFMCFILAVIIGPIIEGVGIALAMSRGGSSGGTDVFSLLINKYFKIKLGLAGFISDFIIIFIGFFVVNDFNLPATLFGIIAAFILSLTIDRVFYSFNSTYVALISSEKYEEINDYIINVASRGATLIKSKGGYSKKDTYLIETCFNKDEYYDMQKEILNIDPNAFIRVMKSQEILGYGFTRNSPTIEDKKIKEEQK